MTAAQKYDGVWVFSENPAVARELLSKGRELAGKLGTHLAAVAVGENVSETSRDLISFGADKVYTVQNPPLKPSYAADLSVFRGGEPQGVRLSPLQPDAETGGRSPWPGGRQCPWTEMSWDTTPCLLMARNLSPADNIYTSISCN